MKLLEKKKKKEKKKKEKMTKEFLHAMKPTMQATKTCRIE